MEREIPKKYDNAEVRRLRKLFGDNYFKEATSVSFRQKDIESDGVQDPVLSEELCTLKYLATITTLDLTDCDLDDASITYLKSLTKVEDLTIDLENVPAAGLANLRGMSELKTLSAEPLSDDGLRNLSACKKLEFVNLGGRRLTDRRVGRPARLSKLEDRLVYRHERPRPRPEIPGR